ncbi:MAG TPA: CinA family nicotinamide mononucleotide deamidase-related protein [Longilinea sp.]|nr:CinA family nicotinamide mononucleotide deamidase-related protein [Longilinea sp.]
MTSAEIIAIGTELLLGDIQDTNTRFLAKSLRSCAINLYRITTLGDNRDRITSAIQEGLKRVDILIISGGLGPTVDDPTREAVAQAGGKPTVFHPELWEEIKARFNRLGRQPTENNRRQAYLPEGADAIQNPVGSAPGIWWNLNGKIIICLPGVPRELEYLMDNWVLPELRKHFPQEGILVSRVFHTAGIGESQVDEIVGDFETLDNPTVGLLAHSGQVDIRLAVKAHEKTEAEKLLAPYEAEIHKRLGRNIYGIDGETLALAVGKQLNDLGWRLETQFNGLDEHFAPVFQDVNEVIHYKSEEECPVVHLDISLRSYPDRQTLLLHVSSPHGVKEAERNFAGPQESINPWSINMTLDFLRRYLWDCFDQIHGEPTNAKS